MFTSVTLHSKANVDNYQHVVARTKRSYLVTKKILIEIFSSDDP